MSEYPKDLNATAAAQRAGCSKATASSRGSKWLSLSHVRDFVNAALKQRAQRVRLTADEVLREIARIAFVDIGEAYDEDGCLLPLKEMPEDCRRALAGIEVEELFSGTGANRTKIGNIVKAKFVPKDRALEMAGKHLKLFTDLHEHRFGVGLADAVKKARERVAAR